MTRHARVPGLIIRGDFDQNAPACDTLVAEPDEHRLSHQPGTACPLTSRAAAAPATRSPS